MKKILSALMLSALAINVATADILEGTTTDIDFLKQTNYSESTLKIVDTIKSENNYGAEKYDRYWKRKKPEGKKENVSFWYKDIKAWFDPMADDGYFGEHEINFDNKFFQMLPSQAIYRKDYNENL